MPPFCLLTDPKTYRACPNDMLLDADFRKHWLEHFKSHFELIAELAVAQYGPARAADVQACREEFLGQIDRVIREPACLGDLNLLVLDSLRQQKLRDYGLTDPFEANKARENEAMLALYPRVAAEFDGRTIQNDEQALLLLVEGLFAGNIFDMGTAATARRFSEQSVDFIATRDALEGKRPWLVDHFELFARRALGRDGKPGGYRKIVFFLDNAGSDCILGVLPFARWLGQRGTTVVLAANRLPALNDVTAEELRGLLERVSAMDPVVARLVTQRTIRVVDSGGVAPLIDLREVSAELNAEAADADLVMLEGMGRAVGSNFDAQFRVDSVKVCMIKDPMIAKRLGGKLFDTVLRFDAGRVEK